MINLSLPSETTSSTETIRRRLTAQQHRDLVSSSRRVGVSEREFRTQIVQQNGVTLDWIDSVDAEALLRRLESIPSTNSGWTQTDQRSTQTVQERLSDGLHVSVSAIKTYLRCPRQFEYRYVRGEQMEFIPQALAFGGAFHGALAKHYLIVRDTGTPPPVESLVQTFSDLWQQKLEGRVPIQADDDEDAVDPVDLAAKMLAAFSAQAALPDGVTVAAVEEPFSVPLHDPDTGEVAEERLVGAFDLILRDADRTMIVEHKSAARKWSADQLEFDLQPTAYRIAVRELGVDDARLRYQIVTKTKVAAVQIADVTRTAQDEDEFLRVASGVLKAVDAGVSYPLRGWHCRSCPYRTACEAER